MSKLHHSIHRVRQRIRASVDELRQAPPGQRFQRYHSRRDAAGQPAWKRALWLVVGFALLLLALLGAVTPASPGILFLLPALAILAAQLRTTARWLDRLEIWLWRAWNRVRPTLKRRAPRGTKLGKRAAELADLDPLKQGGKAPMANPREQKPKEPSPEPDQVDESSEESFPASDSPSWTPVDHTGAPHEHQHRDEKR